MYSCRHGLDAGLAARLIPGILGETNNERVVPVLYQARDGALVIWTAEVAVWVVDGGESLRGEKQVHVGSRRGDRSCSATRAGLGSG